MTHALESAPDRPYGQAPDWSRVRRLLVVRPDNLGDVIMTGPALRALRAHLPRAHITLLASPGGAPAAALLPWLDDVRVCRALWQDLGRLGFDPAREAAVIADLRRGAFDLAVILTSFSQSPHPPALACALAGIPERLGQSRERGRALTFALRRAPDELHQVDRNLRLLAAAGVPIDHTHLEIRIPDSARARARQLLAACGRDHFVLVPFASCQARTYDPLRLARAARRLSESTGLVPVACGGPRDRSRFDPLLAELGPRALDLVGATDLPTFAAVLAGARLVLTPNTAALHLADALAVPQLVLYAGTELPSQWAPRASPHRLLRRDTTCSPCYRFECPYRHECLEFTPDEVTDAALAVLDAPRPAA